MGLFDIQEKSKFTPKLRKLLSNVKVPAKQEQDWQHLENDIFFALDEEEKKAVQTPAKVGAYAPATVRFFPRLPRFSVAYAALAALVLSATGIGLMVAHHAPVANGPTASLVSVQGRIAVKWNGTGTWDTLSSASAVSLKTAKTGAEFSTLAGSSAVILLDKGSIVKLFGRSSLAITATTVSRQTYTLANGCILLNVKKLRPEQRFEIRTPCATCSVVGTIFRVDAGEACGGMAATTLSVYKGKVRMTPQSGVAAAATIVATGRQMTVTQDGSVVFGRVTEKNTPIRDISTLSILVEHTGNVRDDAAAVVDVTSKPEGAKVMIDNSMAGITPLLIRQPAGRHAVAMYADGCAPYEGTLVVGNDRVVSLAAKLAVAPSVAPAPRHPAAPVVSQRKLSETELRLIPEYVEALVDMSSGEYQRSLAILDSLSNGGMVDIKQRMCIMETINACYSKLGDFVYASNVLEDRLQNTESPMIKGQLLWELANMRANCLGDYEGAEMALVEFLILQPDAVWAHDAYGKLAETQYYLGKYKSAAETYQKRIRMFPDDPDIDHSMFNLACILGRDMGNYKKAAGWYTRLLNSFHADKYRSAAFFRRAECYMQMGKTNEAIKDYKSYLSIEPDGVWRGICLSAIKKCKTL